MVVKFLVGTALGATAAYLLMRNRAVPIEITEPLPSTFHGFIGDGEFGLPIGGAEIEIRNDSGDAVFSTTSAGGSFRFTDTILLDERMTVIITPPGGISERFELSSPANLNLPSDLRVDFII